MTTELDINVYISRVNLILSSVRASREGKEGKQTKPRRCCKNHYKLNKATQVLTLSLSSVKYLAYTKCGTAM